MRDDDALLGNVILIISLSVFVLIPGKIVGLTRSRLEVTIAHTRGKHANHYTTDSMFDFTWNYVFKIE